jgi:hypothetical protein
MHPFFWDVTAFRVLALETRLCDMCHFCPLKLFPILLFQTHQHPCWSVGDNYLSTTHPFMALFNTSSVYAPRTLPHTTVGSPTFCPFTDGFHLASVSPSYTWFCHSSETSLRLQIKAPHSFKTFESTEPVTWHYIAEDCNAQIQCNKNLY